MFPGSSLMITMTFKGFQLCFNRDIQGGSIADKSWDHDLQNDNDHVS